jgi:hypothetical protein
VNSFSLAVPQSLTFSFPEPASAIFVYLLTRFYLFSLNVYISPYADTSDPVEGRMEMLHEGFLEVMLWPAVMYLIFKDWAEKTQGDGF